MKKYGFSPENWSALKTEIRSLLIDTAKSARRTIAYSGLTEKIVSANFVPHSAILSAALTEISQEENAAGRGMLSAVVVRKDGAKKNGFIRVAAGLGRDVSDPERCWDTEIEQVCRYWVAQDTKTTHLS